MTAAFRVHQHAAVCSVRMMGPKPGLASEFGRQITIGQRSGHYPTVMNVGRIITRAIPVSFTAV